MICNEKGDKEGVNRYVEKVRGYHALCFEDDVQYDLHSGLAGYLYCLLLIQNNIRD